MDSALVESTITVDFTWNGMLFLPLPVKDTFWDPQVGGWSHRVVTLCILDFSYTQVSMTKFNL